MTRPLIASIIKSTASAKFAGSATGGSACATAVMFGYSSAETLPDDQVPRFAELGVVVKIII